MRAGAWSTDRDLDAARLGWERACRIALPDDDPDQLSMRIASRTMLCATDFQAPAVQKSRGCFTELRELCTAAGDKVSMAIGMSWLAIELGYSGRLRARARGVASEQMALLESIGDPNLTVGLAFVAFGQLGMSTVCNLMATPTSVPSRPLRGVLPHLNPGSVERREGSGHSAWRPSRCRVRSQRAAGCRP